MIQSADFETGFDGGTVVLDVCIQGDGKGRTRTKAGRTSCIVVANKCPSNSRKRISSSVSGLSA